MIPFRNPLLTSGPDRASLTAFGVNSAIIRRTNTGCSEPIADRDPRSIEKDLA